MYLRDLTPEKLRQAHEAAAFLLGLDIRMDRELAIKLDTFRADVGAAIEDLPVDLSARRAVRAAAE
jgi:hypothetical protein